MPGVMPFVEDDGGRFAAGFAGETADCVCRSIAIVTGKPYHAVYRDLNRIGRRQADKRTGRHSSARLGVFKTDWKAYATALGGVWHPTMAIGAGCTVHLRAGELPAGRLLVSCSKHLTAVIDGVIHDTHDPSRGGTRCVYGYFTFPD